VFKAAFISIAIASFFSLLGKESRIGPTTWWLLSFGLFWIMAFLGSAIGIPGVAVAIGAEIVLFLVVTVIWVITPRKSSAEIFASIEKARREREDAQFTKRN
jgi:hypothetical protein